MKNKYKYAIGVSSYNEAEGIEFVINQIDKGVKKYLNPDETIILNLDSNSTDGTKEKFLKTHTKSTKLYMSTPPGKGRAMLKFFQFCVKENIPHVATIDADLKSIKLDWIKKLLAPIIKGFDFVIPVYKRNRFEANITNHFAYPLIFAIYGIELRQPLGGEFGYSLSFCRYLLAQPKHLKTYQYGIDIFITINALVGGFNIAECNLSRKIHAPSFFHMETTFRQVFESGIFVTSLNLNKHNSFKFGKILKNKNSSGIDNIKYFPHKVRIPILTKQLKKRFYNYYQKGLYEKCIEDKTLIKKIKTIIDKDDLTQLNKTLWTDYLTLLLKHYYASTNKHRTKILSRITVPIYRWHAITYWLNVENLSPAAAEKEIKEQALLLKEKFAIL